MILVTYSNNGRPEAGFYIDEKIYPMQDAGSQSRINLPSTMLALLRMEEDGMKKAKEVCEMIRSGKVKVAALSYHDATILAPVPDPPSCRDGYAFRQHVAAARRNRKVDMIPEFDEYPIFYFTNHQAIQGPGEIWCMPDHFKQLDFELEVAVVIGKKGMNIKAADADQYIAGYMIMNDMSARLLQMEEMKLNLGPAKGKDFSTVIGPWLVTPDELEPFKIPCKPGHTGNNYNLEMKCKVNAKEVSSGNVGDMDWTFAEIIERCAYGVNIFPGDVIGSGTVGTGCFLELNGTGKLNDPDFIPQWLQEGDVVEMTVTGLGHLKNTICKTKSDFSILALKKTPVAG
jgi:fumarylacetoacetate (FAA) hydrolase